MTSTRRNGAIAAVLTASAALVLTSALLNTVPHADSIDRLAAQFHESYRNWKPEHGVRSPCPTIQNELNVALLAKYGLLHADADRVVAVTGPPLSVYCHIKYPGIEYWKTRSFWVTMAPTCVMLLPRNPNYDAMMAKHLEVDAFTCDEDVTQHSRVGWAMHTTAAR